MNRDLKIGGDCETCGYHHVGPCRDAAEDAQQRGDLRREEEADPAKACPNCDGLEGQHTKRGCLLAPQPDAEATELSSAPYVRLRAAEADNATLRATVERLERYIEVSKAQHQEAWQTSVDARTALRGDLTKAQGDAEALRTALDALAGLAGAYQWADGEADWAEHVRAAGRKIVEANAAAAWRAAHGEAAT